MTETELSEESTAKPDESRAVPLRVVKKRSGFSVFMPFLAVMLVAVFYFGWWFMRMHMMSAVTVAPSSAALVLQMEQRIATIEQKVQALDGKLNELDTRIDKNSAAGQGPSSAQSSAAPSAATVQAMTRMQNDLTTLSAALAGLQAEVKETGSNAAATQQTTQTALAATIAFIQLREDADAGQGFSKDLSALRAAAGSNGAIQESIAQLEPYAAKGAPTVIALHDKFLELQGATSIAVDKANAQNWWERLLADLKSLISIRPLHGGTTPDAFVATEDALSSGNLAVALEAIKSLPSEAQAVLKGWRAEAEARLAIDTALGKMADHFITEIPVPSAAPAPMPARDEP